MSPTRRTFCALLHNELTGVSLLECRRSVFKRSKRAASSYISKVGSQPLQYATIGQVVERTAHSYPDRIAVLSKEEECSLRYSELITRADKLAAAFLEIGLERGDRVGIWCPNSTQWIVSMLAIARAGLISVALNPSYGKTEIEFTLKNVNVKCLVVYEKVKSRDYYQLLRELLPALAGSTPGSLIDPTLPDLKSVVVVSENNLPGVFNFNKLLESASESQAAAVGRNQHSINPDSGCNVQFTSGTTGKPKAPLLSHHSIVNNGYNVGLRNELHQEHCTTCVQVPLFHVFGVVATISGGLQHGSTLVLPSHFYSPSANVRAIVENKCTTIHGTPTMYVDLLSVLSKSALTGVSARVAVTGGSLVSAQLVRDMQRVLGVQVVKSIYGMTETTAVSFQSVPGEEPSLPTYSVGQVHDHLEVKVCDPHGELVEFGTPGELYVRGYSAMLGYWGDEEKTKEVIVDGWVRTGDQVVLQEDGYCNIVGRLKDIIIRGGENIAPKEIEDVISEHPDVLECQVFGVSDVRLGEDICAAIRLRDGGATLDPTQMTQHCSKHLAKYKLPKYIKRVEHFPKTTSGKVQKFRLREMAEKGEI